MSAQIKNIITEGQHFAKGDSINILYTVTGGKGCTNTVYVDDEVISTSEIVDQCTEYNFSIDVTGNPTVFVYVNKGEETIAKKSLGFKEVEPNIIKSQQILDMGTHLERGNHVLSILSKLAFDSNIETPLYRGEQRKVFEFSTPRWTHVVEIDHVGSEPMMTIVMLGHKGEVNRVKSPLRGWGVVPLNFLRQVCTHSGQTLLIDYTSEHGLKSILRMSKDPVYGEQVKDAIISTCTSVVFEPISNDKKMTKFDERFCNLYR